MSREAMQLAGKMSENVSDSVQTWIASQRTAFYSQVDLGEVYPRDLLDFSGQTFRASAFTFPPYSVIDFEGNNFGGIEYNIANEAAKSLNMVMKVHNPADGYSWGFEKADGDWTGVIGDLQFDRADVSWGHLFIFARRLKIMDFTQWYFIDPTCVMVPNSHVASSKLFRAFEPFRPATWLGVVAMMASLVLMFMIHVILDDKKR